METSNASFQVLINRYNESARKFKILYVVGLHLPGLIADLSSEEKTPPVDQNLTYGKLNVVRKMIEEPTETSPQIGLMIDEIDTDLATSWKWYEKVDKNVTPYMLRSYFEKRQDIPAEHTILLARFLLNKTDHSDYDQGKIDYLLTHVFCVNDENNFPRLRVSSEKELRDEIVKLLPEQFQNEPRELEQLLNKTNQFLKELLAVTSFEDLIAGEYIKKGRALKASFGNFFYTPSVLAKSVQLNTLLRQKFSQLYKIENEKIRQFSQHLIDTGKPIGTISGGEITFESALELSANAGDLLSTDYGQNTQRLQTFVQIKEMLDRAITSSAYAGEQTPSEASSSLLDEDYLSNKLQEREQWLREQLKTMANSLRPNAIQVIELQGSRLVISAWEREALLNTFLDADVDMRTARELLSRCAAIIAEINETYAYYRSQSSYAPHLSDTHLMAVNFYVMQAHQMADELQTLSNKMREAMRIEKACDLSATRQKLLDTCWKLKL